MSNPAPAPNPSTKRAVQAAIFIVLMLAASLFAYKKAARPFDYWMYVAALGDRAAATQHIEPKIIDQRMGFYTVKPLFLAACRGVSLALGPQRAVNFVAAAFYFLLGITVWIWTNRSTILSLLLVASFTIIDGARLGTPDTMQAFLLLVGAWLWSRKSNVYWIPLLLAVWVRADAAILGCLLVAMDSYRNKRIPWTILPIAASAVWLELGYRQLVTFTMQGSYLHGLISTFTNAALTLLFPFMILGALAWKSGNRWLLSAAAVAYAGHLVLFPNADTRYAIVPCLIVGIQAVVSSQSSAVEDAAKFDSARTIHA